MKKLDDLLLTAPALIEPVYRQQDAKFVFHFPLSNQYSYPLYFYVSLV